MPAPTVLVAGGAGYIGSHTCKALKHAGLQPVVLDNMAAGNRFALRYGPFHQGDIADAALVRNLAEEHRPAGAILFAGHTAVGESTQNPGKYFRNNVAGALAFLDALKDAEVLRVVFSSSAAVYGFQERMPIAEDSPKDPLSPYAESKWFVERALKWYGSAYGVRSVSLRYFNAAGADPDGELGESHRPETHLIPLACYAALGRAPLRVFGSDYPTPDGTAIRDYIHVADLADAHVLALHHLMDGGDSLQLNVGTGRGHSVLEVIRAVERAAGTKVRAEYAPRRAGDAPALVADPARIRQRLGWKPRHSSLETIVSTAWRWHQRLEPAALS
jgi:UDP-arabinose 4-epimerase